MADDGHPLNSSQSVSALDKTVVICTVKPTHFRNGSTGSLRHSRQNSRDWEVISDSECSAPFTGISIVNNAVPGICEGFLMKKRKYPLQGWHKRYFVLDKGILKYSKTQQDIVRGKIHGSLDVSLAVMSVNKKSKRIDLDAGNSLYHVKAKSNDIFHIWLTKLTAHRHFKKNEAINLHHGVLQALSIGNSSTLPAMASLAQRNRVMIPHYQSSASLSRSETQGSPSASSSRGNSKVSDWLKKTQDVDLCHQVHASLKSIHESLALERERVRQAWAGPDLRQSTSDQLATLCTTLSELELQSRLTRVHSVSLSSDSSDESYCTVRQDQQPTPSQDRKLFRTPSVTDSTAEYFDASEVVCENLSENEMSDESGLSDITTSNSEPEEGHTATNMKYRASVSSTKDLPSNALNVTGRRTVLPAHSTNNSHIGILSILYNNIGKDLSRVSMPVALNEPLSLLQRVSEELEYSELLDIANHIDDPYKRMVYVAAFSISGYAWASWRNRYKPFNPVLGETYENVREDRGFRYVAEQVSHHPPLSASHAESDNFSFWQDQRWKNKFWGKSVEIVSTGMVNVTLPNYGDHYEWNKVVTCIHNVFSQDRWLEHYGDVVIRNLNSDECTCKITFVKSHYWGEDSGKNEVQGTVVDRAGRVLHRFGGSWNEGIFCDTFPNPQCIWKPNPQPDDYFDYFGFSQYARELNELTPDIKDNLPPTDTRFRPDQRLLEEGKVVEADKCKDEIEEKQRDRRKAMAKRGEKHVPRFFIKTLDHAGREVWVTNGTYWKIRENPGFASTENLDLWC
ncbi:oxysterol-binding protein-related protein 7-like isoform X8 [Ctenopharyngodon idella]|uniref:oxysterol-binding protein-related protein 7-like isoform X8 n=1 Tax=Ctenopharyngodon idella TaxID=7959 RepID=UPI00222FC407|nr:oxysterol-binding protein-related protein 7-like isoform X8 [Ctenopharyngodon idella]